MTADQPEPAEDGTPAETVIETGWATIRVTGGATVITGQVQTFYLGGMPGQGKSAAPRWHLSQQAPEIAPSDADTDVE
jgi:hypothetical protein